MLITLPKVGKAINDYKKKLRSGMRAATGTMTTKDEALTRKKDLTTR